MTNTTAVSELEAKIGYHFQDPGRLEQARIHGSSVGKVQESVRRLAWLGDAVTLAILSQEIYDALGAAAKKVLHDRREELRTNSALAQAAGAIDLEGHLALGESIKRNVKATTHNRMLATHLEAIIGAAFVDGELPAARKVIHAVLGPALRRAKRGLDEP